MSREEKKEAKEVEEKKRRAAEKERRELEDLAHSELDASNSIEEKHNQVQYLPKMRLKKQKNIVEEEEEQKRREIEYNYLRSVREEKRRLRIEELAMAKV